VEYTRCGSPGSVGLTKRPACSSWTYHYYPPVRCARVLLRESMRIPAVPSPPAGARRAGAGATSVRTREERPAGPAHPFNWLVKRGRHSTVHHSTARRRCPPPLPLLGVTRGGSGKLKGWRPSVVFHYTGQIKSAVGALVPAGSPRRRLTGGPSYTWNSAVIYARVEISGATRMGTF